jgi:hypothetical protein
LKNESQPSWFAYSTQAKIPHLKGIQGTPYAWEEGIYAAVSLKKRHSEKNPGRGIGQGGHQLRKSQDEHFQITLECESLTALVGSS